MFREQWRQLWVCGLILCLVTYSASFGLSIKDIQATGKVLFRALRDSECKINCSSVRRRPVCGTDGVTYPSKCDLKRAKRCEGRSVDIKKKGKCSSTAIPVSKCFQERAEAQEIARRPTVGIFIPECNKEGTFASVQCHAATGYCWCANEDGRPVAATSVSGRRPSCRGKSRRTSRTRIKKGCSQHDRQRFNSHLYLAFKEEYDRATHDKTTLPPGRIPDTDVTTPEKQVVEWKFTGLDANQDNVLGFKEVQELKRMVKKLIKPKACAKSFVKYCDLDQNRVIKRSEWSMCLGVDIIKETKHVDDEQEDRGPTDQLPNLSPGPSQPPLLPQPRPRRPSSNTDDKLRSCVEEREAATTEAIENPDGAIFIPSCTDDGLWAKAQCHESTQYCWCVDIKTGRPIPGTSTHKVIPKCDLENERTMKGCPFPKKRQFLSDLRAQLKEEMNIYKSNGTDKSKMPEYNHDRSIYEIAIRWKLKILDSNDNGKLERRELKYFKRALPKLKYTRKCARNFLRFCDENNDKKITVDEWVDCMGVHGIESLPITPKGRNPVILKLYTEARGSKRQDREHEIADRSQIS